MQESAVCYFTLGTPVSASLQTSEFIHKNTFSKDYGFFLVGDVLLGRCLLESSKWLTKELPYDEDGITGIAIFIHVLITGERAGALSLITNSKETAQTTLSQLKILIRPMYSNPPIHGARIVTEILSDPTLKSQW